MEPTQITPGVLIVVLAVVQENMGSGMVKQKKLIRRHVRHALREDFSPMPHKMMDLTRQAPYSIASSVPWVSNSQHKECLDVNTVRQVELATRVPSLENVMLAVQKDHFEIRQDILNGLDMGCRLQT
jgi:hypothetical protein